MVMALPVSMQRDIASARAVQEHEDVVALQMSEATKLVDAAVAAGQPKPQLIPLTARIRNQQEEEEYFALIDEHHDNLEQGMIMHLELDEEVAKAQALISISLVVYVVQLL